MKQFILALCLLQNAKVKIDHDVWVLLNHDHMIAWLKRQPGPNANCGDYFVDRGQINCDGRLQTFL